MEEEIKILKNLIEYLQFKIDSGEHKIIYNDLMYDEKTIDCINSIENLIKAYKELKEIEQIHRQENGELREKVKELEEENKELKNITQAYNSYIQDSNSKTTIVIADSKHFVKGFFKENFIPKQELKKIIDKYYPDEAIFEIERKYF